MMIPLPSLRRRTRVRAVNNIAHRPAACEVPHDLPGLEERTGPDWWRRESQALTPEERALMEPFGSDLLKKSEEILRIISLNICSSGTTQNSSQANNKKDAQMRTLINGTEADIVLIQEENTNYDELPENLHPNERLRGSFLDHRCVTAHNKHAEPGKGATLPGGTSVRVINNMVRKVESFTTDPTGLGRWCSARIRGRQGMMLTTFSAYRPCVNNRDNNSVYNQHSIYLLEQGELIDPVEAFLRDLTVAVKVAYDRGDQIILGADMNLDLKRSQILEPLMENFNLHEAILEMHGLDGPRTYIRGQRTIDCILASRTLQITGCGYLSPPQSPGDHLVLWIDLSCASALGETNTRSQAKEGRKLQLQDPRVVDKYLDNLRKATQKDNLENRIDALFQAATDDPVNVDQERYHGILVDVERCMRHSEEHCRKIRAGNLDWSTVLRNHQLTIAYWKMVIRWKQGFRIDRRYLNTAQLCRIDGIKTPMADISLARAHRILRLQKRNYRKEAKRKHVSNRISFLEDLAEAQTEHTHQTTAAEMKKHETNAKKLKQLIKSEAAKKMHRIIRSTKPSKFGNSSASLSAPPIDDPDGAWVTHTEKNAVETAALTFLMQHYRQAKEAPSLNQATTELFGVFGETIEAQQVLEGTFEFPDTLDPFLVDLLKHCRKPGSVPDIPVIMSTKDFQAIWKQGTKEKTTSSPHSCHFGHFKAIAKDNKLSQMWSKLLSIPMMSGFSPQLYRSMTMLMLEKKPGVIRVDVQRFIALLDSMFSCSCRYMAKRVSTNAEIFDMFAPEQFGSRKLMEAIIQAINLRLIMDLARQLRQPTSVAATDLVHCYDRTTPLIPSLMEQGCGLPISAIMFRALTVQELVAHIRTAHGDSSISSQDIWLVPIEEDSPITSIIQGSPDAPIKWALVTTPTIRAMRSKGFGVAFRTAITNRKLEILGGVFVDDGTYVQQSLTNCGADVIARTQAAQNYLRGLFWATGGAIHPAKSFWWLIDFNWNAGVPSLKKKPRQGGNITIEDKDGNIIPLPRCEFNEAKRILGVHLSPYDKGKGQTQALKLKVDTWATYASTRKINPTFAWVGINSGIMKGVEWPLPACTLSEEQCSEIMSGMLKVALRAAGIQWRLPRKILYGSIDVLGIGYHNLYVTMGIRRLLILVNHASKDSSTGTLIQATYQQLQVELGLPGQIFDWTFDHYAHLITDETWIGANWQFASKYKIAVNTQSPPLKKRRVHDIFLMQHLESLHLSEAEDQAFQRCRLFLQATTLTDICTADGTQITEESWSGSRRENEPMHYKWPFQKRPPPPDWTVWITVLNTLTFVGNGNRNRTLLHPLGIWNDAMRNKWQWFFAPEESRLYHRSLTGWQYFCHQGMASRPNAGIYRGPNEIVSPPQRIFRAKVRLLRGTNIKLLGHGLEDMSQYQTMVTPRSFREILQTLPKFEQYLLSRIRGATPRAITAIAESIQQGTARIVSDGSYYAETKRAAFEVRLEDSRKRHQIVVTQYVPGVFEDNDAYRAEAAGICTGFLLLKTLCQANNIVAGEIKLGCDGQSALNKSTSVTWTIRTSDKHHDILFAAQQYRTELPISINPIWIRGHQDEGPDAIPYCRMDRMTQLNVDCDTGAKALAKIPPVTPPPQVTSPLWTIAVNGVKLVNDIEAKLRKAVHDPQLLDYWHRHGRLHEDQQHRVDWPALQHAIRNTRHCRRKWVTKTYSEECGIGTKLLQWKYRDSAKCPLCGAEVEDIEHMLHCQHVTVTERWEISCDKLDTFLKEQKTERGLRKAIISHLRRWQSEPDFFLVSLQYDHLFTAQTEIGWKNFLFGVVALEWQQAQQEYYTLISSRRTGKRWVSALIRKLWDIAWDLWDHRNSQIHKPGKLDEYEDTELLDADIRTEFALGSPPNCTFRYRPHYRYDNVNVILDLPNVQRFLWLKKSRLIRQRLLEATPLNAERNAMRAWLNGQPL